LNEQIKLPNKTLHTRVRACMHACTHSF